MRPLIKCLAGAPLVFSAIAPAGPAVAQALVGYVASITGDLSEARLVRGEGAQRRLRLGEDILAGDTVIASQATKVRIDTRLGSVDPCQPPPSAGACRRHFPADGERRSSAEIAGRISTMVNWYASRSGNAVTRTGEPPTIKMGDGKAQKLSTGQHSIWLTWINGSPPFRVSARTSDGSSVSIETNEWQATLPRLSVTAGRIAIEVEDSLKRKASILAEAVDKKPYLPSLETSSVNDVHRTILEAGTLMTMEDGAWSLEAGHRLVALDEHPIALAMRRALAANVRPN